MKKPASVYRKILQRVMRYKGSLFASLVLTLLFVLLTLLIPVWIGNAIDCIIGQGAVDFASIRTYLVRVLVATAAVVLFQWLNGVLNNRMACNVVRDLRNDAIAQIERLPMKYLDSHSHGDLISRVITDADQFSDGLLMGFSQFFTSMLTILGTLVLMLRLNVYIALVVVFVTPVSLFVARFISSRTYRHFRSQAEARGDQTAFITENIENIKTVKAFQREGKNLEEFDALNDRLADSSLRAVFFSSLTNPSTRLVNSIVYAGVALFGAMAVVNSQLGFTVGMLSCFLSYANQYTKPFNEISGVITELQNAVVCAERLFALIEERPVDKDKPEAVALSGAKGEFDFANVDFSYDPERPLIQNFNLHVDAGQKIAIVGPTGCGKTTLINLIMRFYDVNEGSISLDGADIQTLTRQSLRANIGMVLQETWIKHGTVCENIALGKPDATRDEIVAAAKAAHAHSFIKRLPQGYDTLLSESDNLSQGQKQLLCIARVMLAMPPILILDEATSSIDTMTEVRIHQAFDRLTEGKTSFIVAHRLSTIREADRILVMKNGNVIESGTHEELLKKNGFYAELYNLQFAHE